MAFAEFENQFVGYLLNGDKMIIKMWDIRSQLLGRVFKTVGEWFLAPGLFALVKYDGDDVGEGTLFLPIFVPHRCLVFQDLQEREVFGVSFVFQEEGDGYVFFVAFPSGAIDHVGQDFSQFWGDVVAGVVLEVVEVDVVCDTFGQ